MNQIVNQSLAMSIVCSRNAVLLLVNRVYLVNITNNKQRQIAFVVGKVTSTLFCFLTFKAKRTRFVRVSFLVVRNRL